MSVRLIIRSRYSCRPPDQFSLQTTVRAMVRALAGLNTHTEDFIHQRRTTARGVLSRTHHNHSSSSHHHHMNMITIPTTSTLPMHPPPPPRWSVKSAVYPSIIRFMHPDPKIFITRHQLHPDITSA